MRSFLRSRRSFLTLLACAIAIPLILTAQGPVPAAPAGAKWLQAQSGRLSVLAASASDLRTWDTQVTRMLRDGDLKVRLAEEDALLPGRTHEHLDQYYNGVRVFGGDLTRQLSQGQTVTVFGVVYAGIEIDTTPTLAPEDATAVIEKRTGATLGRARIPELVVLPRDAGGYVLAYRLRAITRGDLRMFFVDATSGEVVFEFSDMKTTIGSGTGVQNDTKKVSTTLRAGTYVAIDALHPAEIRTYDMQGNLKRTEDVLDGFVNLADADLAADTDNEWTDPATVDAHAYAGWTFDFYFKRFNRQGLNNRNKTMTSMVHPVRRADAATAAKDVFGVYYLNAFYAGDGYMVYGEGLPPDQTYNGLHWNYFAGALDVVAHELTHGVTDYTSALIYRNESGALNEAFSDMMGTAAEFYFQDPGVGYLKADYVLGEDLTNPMSGFRSMANPAAFGDPDHYSKRYLGTADNGGVHTNSGIANHAFYLAIEGGMNRTSGLVVQGVGSANREQIEKVFYRAFTQMLPSSATFAMARAASIQAARDLYGADSTAERAVTQAWTAVGVN